MALTNKLSAIGEAIREKTGGVELLTLDEMPEAIRSIETGGSGDDLVTKLISERTTMTSINIPEEITKIDNYAFQYCLNLSTVIFPDTITTIGSYAFAGCSNLRVAKLPKNLEVIDGFSFQNTLVSINSFPEKVTTIGTYAFQGCDEITELTFHEGIKTIGASAFQSCYRLTTVTFKGTPTTIKNCFSSCSNLKTINVPWAEGAVSGAPWGALGVTINYNYTS